MEESQCIPIKYSQGKGRIGLTWNSCCLYWLCLLDVAREIELHKYRASAVWETVGCALSLWYIKTTVNSPLGAFEENIKHCEVLGKIIKLTGDELRDCFLNGIWRGNGSVAVTFWGHEGVLPHQALAIMIITDFLSNACVRQQARPF